MLYTSNLLIMFPCMKTWTKAIRGRSGKKGKDCPILPLSKCKACRG